MREGPPPQSWGRAFAHVPPGAPPAGDRIYWRKNSPGSLSVIG